MSYKILLTYDKHKATHSKKMFFDNNNELK